MSDSTGTERFIPTQRTSPDDFTALAVELVRRSDLARFARDAWGMVYANDVARLRADWTEAA